MIASLRFDCVGNSSESLKTGVILNPTFLPLFNEEGI